jgi:hypothetical protein
VGDLCGEFSFAHPQVCAGDNCLFHVSLSVSRVHEAAHTDGYNFVIIFTQLARS